MTSEDNYRYARFHRGLSLEARLRPGRAPGDASPGPGDVMPDFDLPTTQGGRVSNTDFLGRKPLLLTCASITCSMTRNAGPVLKELHRQFGDRVAFITLYVREAHPNEAHSQPETLEKKRVHAREYEARDDIPWPVVVDDIDGTLHRKLGAEPNTAYVVDEHGVVVARVLAAQQKRVLEEALARAIAPPRRP